MAEGRKKNMMFADDRRILETLAKRVRSLYPVARV